MRDIVRLGGGHRRRDTATLSKTIWGLRLLLLYSVLKILAAVLRSDSRGTMAEAGILDRKVLK